MNIRSGGYNLHDAWAVRSAMQLRGTPASAPGDQEEEIMLDWRTLNVVIHRLAKARLTPVEEAFRKALLASFADTGKAPTPDQLGTRLGLMREEAIAICRRLAKTDLILWDDATNSILGAYPFSGSPTVHRVELGDRKTVYALCAVDALGIPAMLFTGATVRSLCFHCHGPIEAKIREGEILSAEPSSLVVWFSARDGGCVGTSRCPLINFFCGEDHLNLWKSHHPDEEGSRLTLREAVEAGEAIFGNLLTRRE